MSEMQTKAIVNFLTSVHPLTPLFSQMIFSGSSAILKFKSFKIPFSDSSFLNLFKSLF